MSMTENDLQGRPIRGPEPHERVDHPPQTSPAYESESLGELFSDLSSDFSLLIREEVRLAKAETRETISQALRSMVSLIAGGAIAYAGFIVVLIAVAFVLAEFIALWLATLLVGIVAVLIGVIMIQSGKSALDTLSVTPKKTIETLRDDAEWAKEQVR